MLMIPSREWKLQLPLDDV